VIALAVGLLALATPATAAPASPAVVGTVTAPGAGDVGANLQLESLSWAAEVQADQAKAPGDGSKRNLAFDRKYQTTIVPVLDTTSTERGYVRLKNSWGQCLGWYFWFGGNNLTDESWQNCQNDRKQLFQLVPLQETPSENAAAQSDRSFAIVSVVSREQGKAQCFYSKLNGLHGEKGNDRWRIHQHYTPPRGFVDCDNRTTLAAPSNWFTPSNPYTWDISLQHSAFTVVGDEHRTNRYAAWSHVLGLAIAGGSTSCAASVGRNCAVKVAGRSDFLNPYDDAVTTSSPTLAMPIGCGAPLASGGVVSHMNSGETPVRLEFSSETSAKHSSSFDWFLDGSAELALEGGPGEIFAKKKVKFTVNGGVKFGETYETAKNDQQKFSQDIPPKTFFMVAWTAQVMPVTGVWRFGSDTGLSPMWTAPVGVTVPIAVPGENPLVSRTIHASKEKSCTAGPAATLGPDPATVPNVALAASGSTCAAAVPLTSANRSQVTAGATLCALPGDWRIPTPTGGGSSAPDFAYQWFYVDGDRHVNITGATRSALSLTGSMVGRTLGYQIVETGDRYRLDSDPVDLTNLATVVVSAPAATGEIVNLAGRAMGAVGEPLSQSLLADSDLDGSEDVASEHTFAVIDAATLPAGLTLSADGMLTGTPEREGRYEVTVRATGTDTSDHVVVITINGRNTTFARESALTATVGDDVSLPLVADPGDGMALRVSGDLPEGLVLDTATGVLHGTAVSGGSWTFSLVDDEPVSPTEQRFTMSVRDVSSRAGLAGAIHVMVGEPFSVRPVLLGTAPFLGFEAPPVFTSADGSAVPATDAVEGLVLNADTGALSGTASLPGTITVSLAELGAAWDSDAVPVTIVVDPVGLTELARTGADSDLAPAATTGIATLLAGVLALVLVALRRRSRLR
jgi:hypothetical protein